MSSSQIDQPDVSIGGSGFQFKGKHRAKKQTKRELAAKTNPLTAGRSEPQARIKFYRRLIIIARINLSRKSRRNLIQIKNARMRAMCGVPCVARCCWAARRARMLTSLSSGAPTNVRWDEVVDSTFVQSSVVPA